ncbi:hypothetical protein Cob_v009990 [Colletotrichum orbiculare MAFF 240422]|uniref:Methyltransferase domain-containing protein n=1 Tax=Colletotrichum orbiculare (strain 104-T / ATCC 96160 / CBS 514.97 / LARS 414 / MAFF 240422) TaxID=1213857 RepID=A0A484FGF1_COLOR|nr:hypothetical protein Cob_v009990 [Colletotrichum orbiculare MAFF 240422]
MNASAFRLTPAPIASAMAHVPGLNPDFCNGLLLGVIGGFSLFAFFTLIIVTRSFRQNDIYDVDHWKLNVKVPFTTTWMNMGYWTTDNGSPVKDLEQACRNLLHEVLSEAGILRNSSSPKKLGILDLGIGCGDQSLELARLVSQGNWDEYRYVGLTLNRSQHRLAARQPFHQHGKSSHAHYSVDVFQADAARPQSWGADILAAVGALRSDAESEERWVLGLDSLYHFSPSRRPILTYAAAELDASFMAFDLVLGENVSFRQRIVVKLISGAMKCPVGAFVTEAVYRAQLKGAGYDDRQIRVRDVTDRVFSGLAAYIERQEQALKPFGLSVGKYKVAGRLFGWFAQSKVLRAVIVIAPRREKAT